MQLMPTPCDFVSVTSFPLLVFAALGLVPSVLEHLAMSEVDLTEAIIQRGTTYILVFAFVSDLFRCVNPISLRQQISSRSSS